jgi:tetrapyrrole methylase family protein / MazG family protein
MNILSQTEMARQAGEFSSGDMYEAVATKLIRRHPHVFGDLAVAGSGEVLQNWEAIKQAEREEQGRTQRGPLDGIPPSTPALATAQELARKAARVGFVWPDAQHAWRKVHEEIAEIEAVLDETTPTDDRQQRLEHELGDLLLATSVAARALGIDAESALRTANARFRTRFTTMQQLAAGQDTQFQDLSLQAMLNLWQAAKQEQ